MASLDCYGSFGGKSDISEWRIDIRQVPDTDIAGQGDNQAGPQRPTLTAPISRSAAGCLGQAANCLRRRVRRAPLDVSHFHRLSPSFSSATRLDSKDVHST